MANPHRGQYKLEADGKQYMLEFKGDAICALEAELDMSLGQIQKTLADTATNRMSIVRVVFNAGLVPQDPTVFGKLWPDEIYQHIMAALALAFAGVNTEAEANIAPARPTIPATSAEPIGPESTMTGSGSASIPKHSGTKHPAKLSA